MATLEESQSIKYVDWPASAFDGHRFCTEGYSLEPIKDKYEDAHIYFFRWFGEDNYPGEEDEWPPTPGVPAPPAPLVAPPADGVYNQTVDLTTCNSTGDDLYDFEAVWCT